MVLHETVSRRRAPERPILMWQLAALLILIGVFGLLSPAFFTRGNWLNTSVFTTSNLILALGLTFVIITAGIDLSVGAILATSGAVAAVYMSNVDPTATHALVGALLGVGIGGLLGLMNGLVITRLGVAPVITTLGMLGIGTGIALIVTQGSPILVPRTISPLGRTVWLDWLPVPVLVTAGLAVFLWYLLHHTQFGAHTFAIGSNLEAARRMGINIRRHLTIIYVLSGLLAGVAGVIITSRFLLASPDAGGQSALLNAIAGAIIGGVSLFGGRGSIMGTILGAIIVSQTVTGLVLVGVAPFWQTLVVGFVIIFAVYVQRLEEISAWHFPGVTTRRRSGGSRETADGRPVEEAEPLPTRDSQGV